MGIDENNILSRLTMANWLLLVLLALGGLILGSVHIAGSIVAGGLLAIANFHWLSSVLRRVLQMPVRQAGRFAQIRYVLRLSILGIILWLLITTVHVNIPGLLLGLSLTVINIVICGIYLMARKGG